MDKIKIIFFDIDGTLIDMQKKKITPRILETLTRNAAALGRPVALATASPWATLPTGSSALPPMSAALSPRTASILTVRNTA